jgi:alpha-tubulin suppressor-like RCC1 family protein
LKCWGANDLHQLGADTSDTCNGIDCSSTPIDTDFAAGVQDLALGGSHTCVITAAGAAECVGNNERGQVGSGIVGPDDCFAGRTIPCATAPPVQG